MWTLDVKKVLHKKMWMRVKMLLKNYPKAPVNDQLKIEPFSIEATYK